MFYWTRLANGSLGGANAVSVGSSFVQRIASSWIRIQWLIIIIELACIVSGPTFKQTILLLHHQRWILMKIVCADSELKCKALRTLRSLLQLHTKNLVFFFLMYCTPSQIDHCRWGSIAPRRRMWGGIFVVRTVQWTHSYINWFSLMPRIGQYCSPESPLDPSRRHRHFLHLPVPRWERHRIHAMFLLTVYFHSETTSTVCPAGQTKKYAHKKQ